MQVDIYIDERRVDTSDNTKVSETKQVNDFFEIKDRQTSYTNSFKLPKTVKNKAIFGGHEIPGITALAPYRLHKVSIYRDGIPTVLDGTGYLKETKDTYSLYVYSDNIDLFDTIDGKKLADLDLSAYSHTLTSETFLNSFNNELGYIYAIADYGKLADNVVEWNYTVPSVFIRTLWNKIFEESGYNYEYKGRVGSQDNPFNPFITDEWEQLVITINDGFSNELNGDAELIMELFKSGTTENEGEIISILGQNFIVNELVGEVTEYLKLSTAYDPNGLHQITNSQQYNRSRIRIQENGFYKIELSGILYNTFTDGISLYIEKDGINLFTVVEEANGETEDFGITQRLYLQQGDELFIKVVSVAKENKAFYGYNINCKLHTDNTNIAVNFSSYFSDISQKDFIKDIMRHFGLICRRNGSTYEFICVEELLTPNIKYVGYELGWQDVYVDWSNKFDSILSLDTKIGNYSKNNFFKYQYENSDNSFADAVLRIDDDTLSAETTLIQRIYNAPESSPFFLSNRILKRCTFYEKVYNDDGSLKEVKKKKNKPFLLRISKSNNTISYRESNAENTYSFTGLVPFATFDGLDWNYLIPERYAAFANMLNYGKKYTVSVLLNVIDIHQLDFFKLIYIKQLGGLFYLNKISNYSGRELTKVELIQVRSVERLGQFSDDYNNDLLI